MQATYDKDNKLLTHPEAIKPQTLRKENLHIFTSHSDLYGVGTNVNNLFISATGVITDTRTFQGQRGYKFFNTRKQAQAMINKLFNGRRTRPRAPRNKA